MENIYGVKNISRYDRPSGQKRHINGSHLATGVTHSRSAATCPNVCPTYHLCKELVQGNRSYRSPVPDDFHDQQVGVTLSPRLGLQRGSH